MHENQKVQFQRVGQVRQAVRKKDLTVDRVDYNSS